MPDINWDGDATTAQYSSRFDEAIGNLILAEDNDGNTVLLEWDGSTWQFRGPVELNGEDVSGVGTLTATNVVADSVNTVEQVIKNTPISGRDPITVSDDDVAIFDIDKTVNELSTRSHGIWIMGDDGNTGLVHAAFNFANLISGEEIESAGNTTLSGTTGTDGVTSVAVDGSTFYLENRSGAEQTYDLFEIGREI